jgi:hypothetical protein
MWGSFAHRIKSVQKTKKRHPIHSRSGENRNPFFKKVDVKTKPSAQKDHEDKKAFDFKPLYCKWDQNKGGQ